MSRDNPPAPRQPRAQSTLEYFKEVDRIPESKRTKGQKAFYEKYTSSGSGKKSPLSGLTAPAAGTPPKQTKKYVIRGGRLVAQ